MKNTTFCLAIQDSKPWSYRGRLQWVQSLVNYLQKHIWWHKTLANLNIYNIIYYRIFWLKKFWRIYSNSSNLPMFPPSKVSLYTVPIQFRSLSRKASVRTFFSHDSSNLHIIVPIVWVMSLSYQQKSGF